MSRSARRPVPAPAAEPASRALGPRAWEGVGYRPCQAGGPAVRELFRFAGAFAPQAAPGELAWEAELGGRLIGGVLVERQGAAGFLHGPVVVDAPPAVEPLEVAAQLAAAVLEQAAAIPLDVLFARPQGLDRVWVRSGLVPVPEATVPAGLRGRPGSGLYAWRRPGTYRIAVPDPDAAARRGRR